MANTKNNNKIWIVGAILGAVVGAAYALMKTPMSGEELRSKLVKGPIGQRDEVATDTLYHETLGDKVINTVENTLAPVVGVELGKTATGTESVTDTATQPIVPVQPPTIKTQSPVASESVKTTAPEPSEEGDDYGGHTIRAKRYTWGEPTPEAVTEHPGPVVKPPYPADTEVAKPSEDVQPTATSPTQEEEAHFGTTDINPKHFKWGTPAPEPVAMYPSPADTDFLEMMPEGDSGPVAEAVAVARIAEYGAESIRTKRSAWERGEREHHEEASAEVSPPTTTSIEHVNKTALREFPKLGGLED